VCLIRNVLLRGVSLLTKQNYKDQIIICESNPGKFLCELCKYANHCNEFDSDTIYCQEFKEHKTCVKKALKQATINELMLELNSRTTPVTVDEPFN